MECFTRYPLISKNKGRNLTDSFLALPYLTRNTKPMFGLFLGADSSINSQQFPHLPFFT